MSSSPTTCLLVFQSNNLSSCLPVQQPVFMSSSPTTRLHVFQSNNLSSCLPVQQPVFMSSSPTTRLHVFQSHNPSSCLPVQQPVFLSSCQNNMSFCQGTVKSESCPQDFFRKVWQLTGFFPLL